MRSRKKTASETFNCYNPPAPKQQTCYEGESLDDLLVSIQREIGSARKLDNSLPEKLWLKQQFSIGVNEVTRALEMMPSISASKFVLEDNLIDYDKLPSLRLQAVLLASDCTPRWLTKHLPGLASSRKVPLIFVKDKKRGSLRLGELVKLKKAMAIGVKVKGSAVNQYISKLLPSDETNIDMEA